MMKRITNSNINFQYLFEETAKSHGFRINDLRNSYILLRVNKFIFYLILSSLFAVTYLFILCGTALSDQVEIQTSPINEIEAKLEENDSFNWSIEKNSSGIVIDGNVINEKDRLETIKLVKDTLVIQEVFDNQILAEGKPDDFEVVRKFLIRMLRFLEEGKAHVSGKKIYITGKALNTNISNLVLRLASRTVPKGYEISMDISAPESSQVTASNVEYVEPKPKEKQEYAIQRVFFGTDRAVIGVTEKGSNYGFQRANNLSIGYADVTIPTKSRRFGEISIPNNFTVFTLKLWVEEEDATRHFTIQEILQMRQRDLRNMTSKVAMNAKAYPNTAFVFIHGFNTKFNSAVFRTAQLAWDLRFDGPAFLYSWPSVGDTEDYVTDIDAAAEAVPHMDEFFDIVLSTPGIEHIHVVAHSMGNFALLELLKRAETRLSKRKDIPFNEIILASPDVNVRSFRQVSNIFKRFADNVTLYAASTDRALLASKKLRSNFERLGDVGSNGPAIVPGIYSIDISSEGTDIFSLNHSIFAESKLILSDLAQLFRFGSHPPNSRTPAFIPEDGKDGLYWYVPY